MGLGITQTEVLLRQMGSMLLLGIELLTRPGPQLEISIRKTTVMVLTMEEQKI